MPFDDCDVILSFIGIEGNQAEFWGAYRVKGHREMRMSDLDGTPDYLKLEPRDIAERIWYDLERLPQFEPYRRRVITQWLGTRGWWQTKDLELHEVLPPGNAIEFPGYQDTVLTWSELKTIFNEPSLHRDWNTALSASGGIYRIVDLSTGQTYIGAASGSEGIWGRWADYAQTGHGGNEQLKKLDPNHFQWSIVRTLSGSMSEKEILRVEKIEMRKHDSKGVHGLNLR